MTLAPEAFPLHWPEGYPRTPEEERGGSPFAVTPDQARKELLRELRLLGARYPVVSTNIPIRQDGQPYAHRDRPGDPGAAVYFEFRGEQFAFACDAYDRPWKNLRAIGLTIGAMRTIARYGGMEMMRRSFTGFKALPAPDGPPAGVPGWALTLGFESGELPLQVYEERFKELARKYHPDIGEEASADMMAGINDAIAAARKARR